MAGVDTTKRFVEPPKTTRPSKNNASFLPGFFLSGEKSGALTVIE